MNEVRVEGRLARPAEVKKTQAGKSWATFTIAVNERTAGGKDLTEWVPCQAWGPLADRAGKLRKGELVYVAGRLSIRPYEDRAGVKRTAVAVVASFIGRSLTDEGAVPDTSGWAVPGQGGLPF